MENKICINIQVAPYLAEFLKTHFGDPTEFIKNSPEHEFLRRTLIKTPINYKYASPDSYNLSVVIPYFKTKDPRTYCYMSVRDSDLFKRRLLVIFENNMWVELLQEAPKFKHSTYNRIYSYMERHGINEDHFECIRQKFYRLRDEYRRTADIKLK